MRDSTRLNGALRAQTKRALFRQRFGKEVAALRDERSALAVVVYYATFSEEERKLMSSLPAGWLDTTHCILFQAGEQSCCFNFDGKIYWKCKYGDDIRYFFDSLAPNKEGNEKLIPHSHKRLVVDFTHVLTKRVQELELKQARLEEDMLAVFKQVSTMLGSYATIGGLKKAWPEVEPYLPKVAEPAAAPNLPAVLPSTLNRLLDLPA